MFGNLAETQRFGGFHAVASGNAHKLIHTIGGSAAAGRTLWPNAGEAANYRTP